MVASISLSHGKLLKAKADPGLAARVAKLVYVSPDMQGITRARKGKGYVYHFKGRTIADPAQLERIRKLAIPPSWSNVWICPSPRGHIQATGMDLRNRKQYRYHAEWSQLRGQTKFHHLYEFGKLLPALRRRVKRDLASKNLTRNKVLAAAIELMEKTYIRIGSEAYEKENGSYGLTTLRDKHVSIKQNELMVCFNGKKGVRHNIQLQNKKLARVIKECRDIPGARLFQYYDEHDRRKSIDSSMLNNYIKEATSPAFSAKDIRTWAGSVQAINFMLNEEKIPQSETKSVNPAAMLDWVSEKLGNTRNVCKKYYIHPSLITLYQNKDGKSKLSDCIKDNINGFNASECILMHILKQG